MRARSAAQLAYSLEVAAIWSEQVGLHEVADLGVELAFRQPDTSDSAGDAAHVEIPERAGEPLGGVGHTRSDRAIACSCSGSGVSTASVSLYRLVR